MRNSANSAKEWERLVESARRALHAMCERRPDFVATGVSDDALAAARIADVALDILAGDEERRPNALTQLRRMHDALERTSLDTLEEEISTAVEHQHKATNDSTRVALLRRFLARIGPHLELLGVAPHRLTPDAVAGVLARWRAKPRRGSRDLSTRGVVIALLMLGGEDEQNAKQRVFRRTRTTG